MIADPQPQSRSSRPDPFNPDEILDFLIDPTPAEVFYRDHWEKAPLLVERDEEGRFDPLLTREELERYIEGLDLRRPPIRLGRVEPVELSAYVSKRSYGSGVTAEGTIDSEAMLREYADGASIVIDRAHEILPSIGRVNNALQRHTGAPSQATVYLTPPGTQTFPVHWDPGGFFALQVAGRKSWRVFDQPAPWLLQEQYDPEDPLPDFRPVIETELRPGSTLFVPRGHYHQVVTSDSDSIHISLSMTPATWIDVVRRMVKILMEDRDFREAPVEQVAAVRDDEALRRKWRALLDKAKELDPLAVWPEPSWKVPYDQRGRLSDVRRLSEVEAQTALRVREDREPALERLPDGIRLHFAGQAVRLPGDLEEPIREMLRRRTVRAADLQRVLEEDAALRLVRLLVRHGLLTPAR